jgi:hypothetical protein
MTVNDSLAVVIITEHRNVLVANRPIDIILHNHKTQVYSLPFVNC